MADLVTEIHRLISIAESGKPRLRRSTIWKNKVLDVLKTAQRAELALRYKDAEDTGACDGPWEDEKCDQEATPYGEGMNRTRIERLKRRQAATSTSSTERTRTASVTVLKP